MAKKSKKETEVIGTEEKIKAAARKIFTKKGYAATRTRDIAEEAGMNLALLNYYFRSKEKLFDIIMTENLQHFLINVKGIISDETTSLETKVETLVNNYCDMLMKYPDLPLFIFSELRADPERLANKIGLREHLLKSPFIQQIQEVLKKSKIKIHPLHFMVNIISMIIFPFIAKPVIQNIGELKQQEFMTFIEERKKMIPKWVMAQLIVPTDRDLPVTNNQ